MPLWWAGTSPTITDHQHCSSRPQAHGKRYSSINFSWGFPRALGSQHPFCPSSRPLRNSLHALHLPGETRQPASTRKSRWQAERRKCCARLLPGTVPHPQVPPRLRDTGIGGKVLFSSSTTTPPAPSSGSTDCPLKVKTVQKCTPGILLMQAELPFFTAIPNSSAHFRILYPEGNCTSIFIKVLFI